MLFQFHQNIFNKMTHYLWCVLIHYSTHQTDEWVILHFELNSMQVYAQIGHNCKPIDFLDDLVQIVWAIIAIASQCIKSVSYNILIHIPYADRSFS